MPSTRTASRSSKPVEPRTFHFQPNIDAESYPKTLGHANYGIDPSFNLIESLGSPASSNVPSPTRRRNSRTRPARRQTSHAAKKPDGHIPRPPNCFLLYRSWARKQKMATMSAGSKNEQKVSVIVGGLWEDLPEEKKAIFRHQAAVIKAEHQLKYPDYKYTPRSKKGESKRKAKKMDAEDSISCRQVADQLKEGGEEDELLAGVRRIEEQLNGAGQEQAVAGPSAGTSTTVPATVSSITRPFRRSSSCPVPDVSASRIQLLCQPTPTFYAPPNHPPPFTQQQQPEQQQRSTYPYPPLPMQYSQYSGPIFTDPFGSSPAPTLTSPREPRSPYDSYMPHHFTSPVSFADTSNIVNHSFNFSSASNSSSIPPSSTSSSSYPPITIPSSIPLGISPLSPRSPVQGDDCATPSSLSNWSANGSMGPETPQPEQIYAPRNQLSALADLGSFVNFDWSNVQAAEIAVPPGTMLSSPVDHALLSPSSINYNTTAVATNSYNNEMLDLNLAVGLGAELYTGDHLFDFEFVTRKESVSALNNMNWMNAHGDQLQALGSLSNGGSRRGSAADWRRGSLFWLRKSQSGASGSGLGMGTSGEPLSPSTPTAGMAGLGLTSPVHSNPPPASDAMFTDHHHHHHQVAGTNMGEWQHPGEGFRRRSSMAGDLFLGLAGGSEYSASRPLHNFSLVV